MGDRVFYVTTPIYYPNDVPHIGHAYTTVATDVVARYHRLRGEEVFFLTGTDEHGLKLQRAAEEAGVEPRAFVDGMEPRWREVWERLHIAYDDYIRTTEPRHEAAVRTLLQAVHDNGRDDIYLGTYEGWYCVSCEAYYAEEELVEGNCPIHGRPVERYAEENYFFRLSAYRDPLLAHYERHPEAVRPVVRLNEVLGLLRGGLRDFSISRTSFTWGIPLPWDPKHVCYVWFDALTNYLTAAGYDGEPDRFTAIWPADIHFVGKDILRFHAVYWPAMLMAAGVEPPRCVWAHGFLLVGGEKMSKTRLTGIHPFQLLDVFGPDSYRYYFLREIRWGEDGSFSWESMVERHNADLANGLGNLASRVLAMLGSYLGGAVPDGDPDEGSGLREVVADAVPRYERHMLAVELTQALGAAWDIVDAANKYLVERAPWNLAREPGRRRELEGILYAAAETLRILAVLISPVMPGAAARLWGQLGVAEPLEAQRLPAAAGWGGLEPGTRTSRGDALFPRVEP
ncbi:MAG TPA: methionine--tRNA ligase [Actinomycetota bacterium]|nr:methionine--tRNA ligase [Actinomycetota bacterium]